MQVRLTLLGSCARLALRAPRLAQQAPPAQNTLPTAHAADGRARSRRSSCRAATARSSRSRCRQSAGDATTVKQAVDTASRDFTLSSMFQVLDPQSFTANLAAEGDVDRPDLVAQRRRRGRDQGQRVARAAARSTSSSGSTSSRAARTRSSRRTYDVAAGGVRARGAPVRQRGREVVHGHRRELRHAPRLQRDDRSRAEGHLRDRQRRAGARRGCRRRRTSRSRRRSARAATSTTRAVCRTAATRSSRSATPAPVLQHAGLVFGVAFGGGKMALVVSQNGQSDIWTARPTAAGLHEGHERRPQHAPRVRPRRPARVRVERGRQPADLRRRQARQLRAARTTWRPCGATTRRRHEDPLHGSRRRDVGHLQRRPGGSEA